MVSTNITFYGHALFVITTGEGKKIGTDPYDEQIRDPLPDISADIVTSSHDHYDHANIGLFKGDPVVINTPGETIIENIRFFGLPSFHDEAEGSPLSASGRDAARDLLAAAFGEEEGRRLLPDLL